MFTSETVFVFVPAFVLFVVSLVGWLVVVGALRAIRIKLVLGQPTEGSDS